MPQLDAISSSYSIRRSSCRCRYCSCMMLTNRLELGSGEAEAEAEVGKLARIKQCTNLLWANTQAHNHMISAYLNALVSTSLLVVVGYSI